MYKVDHLLNGKDGFGVRYICISVRNIHVDVTYRGDGDGSSISVSVFFFFFLKKWF